MHAAPLLEILLLASAGGGPARAEAPAEPVALWVELEGPREHQLARRLGLGHAEGQQGSWWRMDGPPGVEADLDAAGLRWRPHLRAEAAAIEDYHDAEEVLAALQGLAVAHPDLVELVDLGWSTQGRPLRAVRITRAAAPRAGWRLVGTHHGDEWTSSEVALEAARRLVQDADTDADLADLLARDEVWVLPQLNPDGFEAASRYSATTVDLNRNYDFAWSAEEWLPGDAPFSEPETRALRALHLWQPFVAGLSFHAGAANIGWVWNHDTSPTEDDALLQALAGAYGEACTAPGFWMTNGATWYITNGDTNDWAYGRLGVLDFTVEVSTDKVPDGDELPALREDHWPAVRAFLLSLDPAAGQVVDAGTGLGLPATITLADEGQPLLTGPDGHFARALAGPALARVASPGFAPVELTLSPGQDLRVALERADLVAVRAMPARLAAGGPATFALDVDSPTLTLSRPGHEPVPATPVATGWQVDTTGLAAGPWDLEVQGGVAPRALFVGEVDQAVAILSQQVDGDRLALTGQGFGAGTRAWALVGQARSPLPLSVLEQAEDRLELDLAAVEPGEGVVDLVLLTNGRQLAALDVGGALAPPADTGLADSGGAVVLPADSGALAAAPPAGRWTGGCSAGPSTVLPSPALALALPLLLLRRRSAS